MNSRRKFLQGGLLTSVAALAPSTSSVAKSIPAIASPTKPASGHISILQTTDVHCQLHAHDELFWEKDELVFRKAGG
jgi:2',3'-cyclic-nucleotide 2'-phosphodiesterase (5'-nucleotidase family)